MKAPDRVILATAPPGAQIVRMSSSKPRGEDRRNIPDRRFVMDRRAAERRQSVVPVSQEQRSGRDRRVTEERRVVEDRRVPMDRRANGAPVETHLHAAIALLERLSDGGHLTAQAQRELDAALFRLKFALDRLADEEQV
jgi:hypothetical protein